MSRRVCYVYNDEVCMFEFGKEHVMNPQRFYLTNSLIEVYKLDRRMKIVRSSKATFSLMGDFHSEDYLDFLRRHNNGPKELSSDDWEKSDKNEIERYVIDQADCPLFPGVYDYSALCAGGSLVAAHELAGGAQDVCLHWPGGWHHARRANAAGFCYVNDAVLAIRMLLQTYKRVLYVDIDVHHGDGVEEAFRESNRVFTLSLHKYGDGFFPCTGALHDLGEGAGRHYTMNVPLKVGMDDETYQMVFEPLVWQIMQRFQPEAVVMQCGADSLAGDPLGPFNLTTRGHCRCVEYMRSRNLPLLLLGGGGYSVSNVARAWCLETGAAVGRHLEEDIPFELFGSADRALRLLAYEFGPDYRLNTRPRAALKNANTFEYIRSVVETLSESLRMIEPAPSVPVHQPVPEVVVLSSDSEDEDVRCPRWQRDSRVVADNEFYSDDED